MISQKRVYNFPTQVSHIEQRAIAYLDASRHKMALGWDPFDFIPEEIALIVTHVVLKRMCFGVVFAQ